jgi:transposase
MPQPLRMHQIKRIIEFHLQGHKLRHIGRLTGISRNTIREYLRRISLSGKPLKELISLSDDQLISIAQVNPIEKNRAGRTVDDRYKYFQSKLDHYKTELGRPGVTRYLLWQEYRSDQPEGYGYSQFCEYLSRYLKRDQAVMRFSHRPGEQMQADFAGDKLGYIDRGSVDTKMRGNMKAELLVGIRITYLPTVFLPKQVSSHACSI